VGEKKKKSECENDGAITNCNSKNVSNTKKQRLEGPEPERDSLTSRCTPKHGQRGWDSDWWEAEPSVGRVANGVPKRVDRLKGLGNAIVPQVAYEIFKAIDQL
jgi:DNA (cytosine-5)-methyltransferase 1